MYCTMLDALPVPMGLPQRCFKSGLEKVVKPSCSQRIKYAVLEQDYRNTQVSHDQAMLLGLILYNSRYSTSIFLFRACLPYDCVATFYMHTASGA